MSNKPVTGSITCLVKGNQSTASYFDGMTLRELMVQEGISENYTCTDSADRVVTMNTDISSGYTLLSFGLSSSGNADDVEATQHEHTTMAQPTFAIPENDGIDTKATAVAKAIRKAAIKTAKSFNELELMVAQGDDYGKNLGSILKNDSMTQADHVRVVNGFPEIVKANLSTLAEESTNNVVSADLLTNFGLLHSAFTVGASKEAKGYVQSVINGFKD